ncbi:hypothetical protein [Populibacterium corticicola]|uniref:hypothetical protein n=1 Tax=Populibacterium corticicola TaxID=1812826 RepID=UPI003671D8FD
MSDIQVHLDRIQRTEHTGVVLPAAQDDRLELARAGVAADLSTHMMHHHQNEALNWTSS